MALRFCVWVLAMLAVVWAGYAEAEAPKTSIRPMPRVLLSPDPVEAAPVLVAAVAPSPLAGVRPRSRPASLVTTLASAPAPQTQAPTAVSPSAAPASAAPASATPSPAAPEAVSEAPARKGLFGLLRPAKRPEANAKSAQKAPAASLKGSVCGDPMIKGEILAPVKSKVKGCGIPEAVRVTSVAGVRLSTPATINCSAAKALKTWVQKGVEPVYGKGKVVQLEIAASYSCRPRNNKKGARVSEHGRGNAIDISGLTFSNGKSVSVLRNYDKSMRKIHKNACGIFGTTLGPGSDGYHENHLHFDTVRYRNGTYCR
jgi:hypothetical protein